MSIVEIIGGVLLIIIAVVLTTTVTMQEPKGNGLQAVSGAESDTFYGKNGGRTSDAMLARISKMAGIGLFAVALLVLAAELYL